MSFVKSRSFKRRATVKDWNPDVLVMLSERGLLDPGVYCVSGVSFKWSGSEWDSLPRDFDEVE